MRLIASCFLGLTACSSEPAATSDTGEPIHGCIAGELTLANGQCLAAGFQENGCPAGETANEDGSCRAAGVPPERCAQGFAPDDGGGCRAILPSVPCAPGTMAIMGERRCREVAPCAAGIWGDIPVDGQTEFVDQSYAGMDSDGSQDRPWTTIQQAIDGAASGAIVAVAAGVYAESLTMHKPVTLWGKCPGDVEVRGAPASTFSVIVAFGADAAELRDLAITGDGSAVGISGSEDVVLDRLWLHDADRGLEVQDPYGPTSVTLRRTLVEQSREMGILWWGSSGTIEETVVRDTEEPPTIELGYGINVRQDYDTAVRSNVAIRATLVERNHVNVFVTGSQAHIEGSLLRDGRMRPEGTAGRGVNANSEPMTSERAEVAFVSSVIERNHEVGLIAGGADVSIDATVVRDTQPSSQQNSGIGISIQEDVVPGVLPATVILRDSLIDANMALGVHVRAGQASIASTIMRATRESVSGEGGYGIAVEPHPLEGGSSAIAAITGSVVEGNREVGVFLDGSTLTLTGVVVHRTQSTSMGVHGRALEVQQKTAGKRLAVATVRSCRFEDNAEVGISVWSSEAIIEASIVRGTRTLADGTMGDGIAASSTHAASHLSIAGSIVEASGRAGISNYGASVRLWSTLVSCNTMDLVSDPTSGWDFHFTDEGGNECGCGDELSACKAVSQQIQAPTPPTLPDSGL